MNITSGINGVSNTYNFTSVVSKTSNENVNTVTAEDIVAHIKALGAASVVLDEKDYYSLSNRNAPGLHINISPTILQRMLTDSEYREKQYDIIRNNIEVIADPRVLAARNDSCGPEVIGYSSFGMIMWPGTERSWEFSVARFVGDDEIEASDELTSKMQKENIPMKFNMSLSQMFMNKFAIKNNPFDMFEKVSNAYDKHASIISVNPHNKNRAEANS